MATRVRILRNPPESRVYQAGQVVTLPDPRAAKLVATGCAELADRSAASPQFAMMIDCFRSGSSAPKPRRVAKLPDVSVRLTDSAKLDGRTRAAGSVVSLSESRAARLIASGRAEMPSKPSPRLSAIVAELRQAAPLLESYGVQFATLLP